MVSVMSIVITGATGQLGQLIIADLLAAGVPASDITAAVRTKEKGEDLAARGIQLLIADYDDPSSWSFAPEDRVLLISASTLGKRATQHTSVINAARTAGVAQLAYTSLFGAPTADGFLLADEHRATEQLILDSGLPYTFLRNNWYSEMYTDRVADHIAQGAIVNAVAPTSRIASATRADYAAAAARVLSTDGHLNKAYELSGNTGWTFEEFAAEVSRVAGKTVIHTPISVAENKAHLTGAGLPEQLVEVFGNVDESINRGALAGTPGDLARLIGRPTEPIAETIARAATVHPLGQTSE
jgi:NAD(P)H dehydrogenase (quinone)